MDRRRVKVYTSRTDEHVLRGTAKQLTDKYEALANDSANVKDRIAAERFAQAADHYRKIEQ